MAVSTFSAVQFYNIVTSKAKVMRLVIVYCLGGAKCHIQEKEFPEVTGSCITGGKIREMFICFQNKA